MSRRLLPSIVLLAVLLHLAAIARTVLPAQDGLKFIRVAEAFQTQPWDVAVRNSDQHPLYPALVAVSEPLVAYLIGPGPECWRISAQVVSMLASLLTLWPLYLLSRRLFDGSAARLSVLLWVLMPLPAEIGHDSLADALALLATASALMCAERAFVTRSVRYALACGLVSGIGFLARPEVAVVPLALSLATLARGWRVERGEWREQKGHSPHSPLSRSVASVVGLVLIVGVYALFKGDVSEKLAVRAATGELVPAVQVKSSGHALMPGMEAEEWNFSAKEESGNPSRLAPGSALVLFFTTWAESLAWVGAALAVLGAIRVRSGPGRVVVACYLGLFGLVLVRHATQLGYLSGRHVLSLTLLSTPWAAAGLRAVGLRISGWLKLGPGRASRLRGAFLLSLVVSASLVQLRPAHASRWGHREAGLWISRHAGPGDAVLDTRGWAAFVAGQPSYDYWHVRQALTDSRLTYIVVGRDELEAHSGRAKSLRRLLDQTSQLVAGFPEREGGPGQDILVYRFQRPSEWEGVLP
jgi:hypothetical protein